MKRISVQEIIENVAALCAEANIFLAETVKECLAGAARQETSPLGRKVLEDLLENARVAEEDRMPLCQDTGVAVLFVELGQEVEISGGILEDALNEGVRQGYSRAYLRKSVVQHPLERVNTGDNTPAVIHYRLVPGNQIKITLLPKGAGSENMSALAMLKPADGREGVINFIVETVAKAGPNPCPPLVVGVGLGGTFEKAALLAKEALVRPVGSKNPDHATAELEEVLLGKINDLGIGPQGFGGTVTALAVHIETYPTHIASLPVAVNISCHAYRHKTVVL